METLSEFPKHFSPLVKGISGDQWIALTKSLLCGELMYFSC